MLEFHDIKIFMVAGWELQRLFWVHDDRGLGIHEQADQEPVPAAADRLAADVDFSGGERVVAAAQEMYSPGVFTTVHRERSSNGSQKS